MVGVFRCWEFLNNRPEDPDVIDAIGVACSAPPNLTVFCRLDELGLVVTGQHLAEPLGLVTAPCLEWLER